MRDVKFGGALKLRSIERGKKAVTAVRAELILNPTYNKFTLNSIASELLKVQNGDYVAILVNDDSTSIDDKFFIVKTSDTSKALLASVKKHEGIGRNVTFSYSGVYSQILQFANNIKDGIALSAKELTKLNLMQERETPNGSTAYSALKKVKSELVAVNDGDGNVMTIDENPVFSLCNIEIEDYTPRELTGEASEDVPGELTYRA
jgi:hypothetical protein